MTGVQGPAGGAPQWPGPGPGAGQEEQEGPGDTGPREEAPREEHGLGAALAQVATVYRSGPSCVAGRAVARARVGRGEARRRGVLSTLPLLRGEQGTSLL